MYNEDWAPLYRETFARLHCPAAVRLPQPRAPGAPPPGPAVLCAAALAACGALRRAALRCALCSRRNWPVLAKTAFAPWWTCR